MTKTVNAGASLRMGKGLDINMKRRVVVTGMGAVTPIGIGMEAFWNGIRTEKIGFAPITGFDTADYKCKLAAEVKGFKAEDYMDKKAARRMEPFCQYAVAAAGEALRDAALDLWEAAWEACRR